MKNSPHPLCIAWAWLAVLLACLPAGAAETAGLEKWRGEIAVVRALAENDAPQAYLEAQLLQRELPAEATAADKARMLNLLARIELHLALIPQSARHGAEAWAMAKQGNDLAGQVEADLNMSLSAINQGRLDDMIEATRDGMSLLEHIQRDDLRAEEMYHGAMMYLRFGQLDEAVTVAMQALEVANNSGNPLARAYAEQGMGVVYVQSGRYAEARQHYQRMLEEARQSHYTLLEAAATLGLASVAGGVGDSKEGERLVKEAIGLFRRVGAPFFVSHAQHVLADQYLRNKQQEKALALINDNAVIYEKHENPIGLWWTLQARSKTLQALGRLEAARGDAERAYALAQKIGFNIYLGDSARRLAEVTAAQGDIKQAYRWSAEAIGLKEKADREKSGKRIVELAKRFREESKQRRIDELTRDNQLQDARQRWLWTVLGGSLAMLGGTAYFLFRLQRKRNEIRTLNIGLEQRVKVRTAELFDSRQSLAEAQRIAHVGSWELDHVANALTWSDETHRIFEVTPQQFGGTYEAFLDAVHPEDRERVDRIFRASLENCARYEIEHRLSFPGGRIKYVHEHCETLYDADGKAMRSIGTVQDITARKEMENALRESQQLLAEAQRIAHVGSWEYDIASDTHTWSDELFRIYEIDPAHGASYEGCDNATHPDDREAIARAYLDSVETGMPYESEHRLRMADGRIKYVHERGETVRGTDGELLRAVGMMQDITERKRMEEELRNREQMFRTLAENAPDNIIRYDRDCRILYINPNLEKVFGQALADVAGKTPSEAFPDGRFDEIDATVRQVIGSGQPADFYLSVPDGGEGVRQHHLRFTPERDGSGRVYGVLAIGRDVTALKRLEAAREAALAEAQRLADLRSEFIAHMSHELRTPLNAILGYAQLMGWSGGLDEKQREGMEVIRQSGEHLLALIDDILDLARIESGKLELDISDIPLARFLHFVAGVIGVRAGQKHLAFSCELEPGLPQGVRGDEKRLRQVLLNLLSNAVKYTDSGKVTLHVRRAGQSRLAFIVADTGIGINEAEKETIFQPFEQAGDARRRVGGSGLGLSISRQLVRLMGGEIEVESREGEGSTFRFELELPECMCATGVLSAMPADGQAAGVDNADESAAPLLAPPQEEIRELHRLALLGNMRDIAAHAERIGTLYPQHRPFAGHLKRLADGFRSKAILALAETHLLQQDLRGGAGSGANRSSQPANNPDHAETP